MFKKACNTLLFIAVFAIAVNGCSKKEEEPLATIAGVIPVVTFTLGDVKKIKTGITSTLAAGEKLAPYDEIVTGKSSLAVIQIKDDSVVRIQENTRLVMETLTDDSKVLNLREGQILAKIVKLDKSKEFSVKTQTVLASVRGTSFRVSQTGSTCTIAVADGKVAVAPADKIADTSSTLIAETGFSVEANKPADAQITTVLRKSTEAENLETKRIESVPIITDADKKSVDELNILFKEVIESDKAIDEELKSTGANKKQEAIIKKQSGSLTEIKDAFNRLDEITLYNKRVITGIIVSRGSNYQIVTPDGKVTVAEKDVKNVRIIK